MTQAQSVSADQQPKFNQKFRPPKQVAKQQEEQETTQSVQSVAKPLTQEALGTSTQSNSMMRQMVEGIVGTITFLRFVSLLNFANKAGNFSLATR